MANTTPLVPGRQLRRPAALPKAAECDDGALHECEIKFVDSDASDESEGDEAKPVRIELRRGEMRIDGRPTPGWYYDGPLHIDLNDVDLTSSAMGLLNWLGRKMEAQHVRLGDRDGDVTQASVFFAEK